MQIVGSYVRNYGVVSGEKDGKEWQRVTFAIVTNDDHHRFVAFTAFGGDKCLQVLDLQPGQVVMVDFYPSSREYLERVYTELNMVRLSVLQQMPKDNGSKKGGGA